MDQILKEIEQAAERCVEAAEAVRALLETGELGFIAEILPMVMSSERMVRTSRRGRALSSPPSMPSQSVRESAVPVSPKRVERVPAAMAASLALPTGSEVTIGSPARRGAEEAISDRDTSANAAAKEMLRKSFSDAAIANNLTGLDRLRSTLAQNDHPVVKASNEALEALEYVNIAVLPKIDVLSDAYQDRALKVHQEQIVRLIKKRGEAHKGVEDLALKLFTLAIPKIESPEVTFKLLNVALGQGRTALVGIAVGCAVLDEVGVHLKQVCSRIQMRMALAGQKAETAGQVVGPPRPRRPAETKNPARTDGEGHVKRSAEQPVDFVILTAIEVELRAVLAAFGLTQEDRVKIDARVYWRGTLPLNNGERYSVVVGLASDMANTDAALTAADMLNHWNPNVALLVGIAATTAPSKVKLGDVVVGREVYYYERGKVTRRKALPEPKIIPADLTLLSNLQSIEWSGSFGTSRPDETDTPSIRHFGVIACGEQVIADVATRDRIVSAHRKVLAIEMEGYGFSLAGGHRFEKVRCLIIRGISDDGSENKDDRWHKYAAAAAADVARQFLLDRPLEPRGLASTPPPAVEVTDEEALRELERAGRVPVFRLRSAGRSLNQPEPGKVTFKLHFVNEGPCALHELKLSREGHAFISLARSYHPREEGHFNWPATLPPKNEKLVMPVRFRYSNGFGDNLQEDWELTFDLGAPGGSDVSVRLTSKQLLPSKRTEGHAK